MAAAILDVQGTFLASEIGLAREPIRAPHLQEPGFEQKLDYSTLFYDVIRIITPRLFNHDAPLKASRSPRPMAGNWVLGLQDVMRDGVGLSRAARRFRFPFPGNLAEVEYE